jgi:DNA polymerase elongation subunit (family B)
MYIHIFDAHSEDVYCRPGDSGPGDSGPDDVYTKGVKHYQIKLFGATVDGNQVQIDVTGFRPFLYVSMPEATEVWKKAIVGDILRRGKDLDDMEARIVKRGLLYGYTGGKEFPFLELSVGSISAMYTLKKTLLTDTQTPKLTVHGHVVQVYEGNIDPMLRFFHMRNINPCGWISIDDIESDDEEIVIECDWKDIEPCPQAPAPVAPFRQVIWDIECDSFDGSFPVAKQGYRRVAKQLWDVCGDSSEVGPMLTQAFQDSIAKKEGLVRIPPFKKPLTKVPDIPVSFIEACKRVWLKRDSPSVKVKEECVQALTVALDSAFAKLCGDPIIQIGSVFIDGPSVERHIFVLGTCDAIDGVKVHSYRLEEDLLMGWIGWLIEYRVDIFVGYNTSSFDERYVWERLEELGLSDNSYVQQLSRLCQLTDDGDPVRTCVKLEEKRLASSALGDNTLYLWTTPGRLRIDLLGHIRRKAQLPSYKLDAVCAVYLSGVLDGIEGLGDRKWLLKTSQKKDAKVGRAIQILDGLGEDLTDKLVIDEVTDRGLVVQSEEDLSLLGEAERWAVVKDDVSPQDIFRLQKGSSADRATVAAYCIQDCDLTYELYKKLEVFNETMSMANVCSVPVSYIFTRGQGIKIESLIFKECRVLGQLIKVLEVPPRAPREDEDYEALAEKFAGQHSSSVAKYMNDNMPYFTKSYKKKNAIEKLIQVKIYEEMPVESYEGAVVLVPEPNFYKSPVGVCDFASLYPSTIISENISYDMLVWVKDFDTEGKLMGGRPSYGAVEDEANASPGTTWTDIEFDILGVKEGDTRKNPVKVKIGTRVCRYAQPPEKGSLPKIVAKLLAARKAKRVEITKTSDPFKKALLDAEQNAYKITANSLYGQLGSPTFKIRLQNLAASVTAYGRKQIMFSKAAIEQFYGPGAGDPRCSAVTVYGDTDSIFVNFNPRGPDGAPLKGREAVVATMELTEEAGKFITGTLKDPHDFEFDKVIYPFIIFSKKRYTGMFYEDSPDSCKEKSMGIVLKRRDNAPILKQIYGAAVQELLLRQDVVAAVKVVKEGVRSLVEGKVKLSMLTITKSLRSEYKTTPPAHKILADRMAVRDPGNAPASGERVGYVYIVPTTGKKANEIQGDRVETPAFIRANGLQADYEYYILHQLMNPLSQLFGIFVDEIPGYKAPPLWEDDAAAQKERIAAELLFSEGLNLAKELAKKSLSASNQTAKRAFIGKFFSQATPTLTKSLATVEVKGDPSITSELSKYSSTATKKSLLKESSLFADQAAVSRACKKKTCKPQPSQEQSPSIPTSPSVPPAS